MIIVLILFWSIGLFLSIKSPTYFVLYFLLASTKFLGFIDPSTFIVNGIEFGYFGLNIIALAGSFLSITWYNIPKKSILIIFIILAMLIYGISKPIFDGNSTLLQSFMASKEIWFYFLFFYMVSHRKKIKNEQIIILIKWIGLYFSLIYIFGILVPGIVPPYYFDDEIIRVYYPTYISFALFLFAVDLKTDGESKIKQLVPISLLLVSLVFAGYASLTIMSVIGLVGYLFVYHQKKLLNKKSIFVFFIMSVLIVLLLILINEETYNFLLTSIYDIISGNDPSISSRMLYNEFRWEFIDRQREFGYGFIHQSSEIMKSMNTSDSNRYMQRLGVIDSGYVDMFTKFGFIGTAIIIVIFLKYMISGFLQNNKNALSLAMLIYFAQYFFVNYTWSVFTFAHGIIPGVIALYMIFWNQSYKSIKTKKRLAYRV
jgi:hypothetical protein